MRYVEEAAEGEEEQDALEAGLLQDVDELLEDDNGPSSRDNVDFDAEGREDNDDSSTAAAAAAGRRPLASAYDASPRVPEGALLDVEDDDDLRPPLPSSSRTNQPPSQPQGEGEEDGGDGGGGWGDAFSDYSAREEEEEEKKERARASSNSIELDSIAARFGPAGSLGGHSRGDSAAWGLEEEEEDDDGAGVGDVLYDAEEVQSSPPVVVDLARDKKERID